MGYGAEGGKGGDGGHNDRSGETGKSHACSKMSVRGFSPSSGHIPALCESLVRMLTRQTRTGSRILKKEWNVFLTHSYLLTVRFPLDVM